MVRRAATALGIDREGLLLHAVALALLSAIALSLAALGGHPLRLTDVAEFVTSISLQVLVPVYGHFALWRFTMARRRWGAYASGLLLIAFGWPWLISATGVSVLLGSSAVSYGQFVSNTFFGILLATGIRAIYRLSRRERELRALRQRQTESELAGLKAQLNPHFLFNTLNNIYGVNLDDPERGSAMLLELADVMRYHLELSQRASVPLAEEIALIRSVVQLEALRLRENTTVELSLPDDAATRGITIPPLLLVPFVENAFKHGTHSGHGGTVRIRLTLASDVLTFETDNPLYPDRQTVSTGVGEANVRQRLRLLYADAAALATGPAEGRYRVCLRLPLTTSASASALLTAGG